MKVKQFHYKLKHKNGIWGSGLMTLGLLLTLDVMTNVQLSFTDCAAVIFALYDIQKIRCYLTQYAAQLLVQAVVITWLDL